MTVLMRAILRSRWWSWTVATVLWLGLGFSLGWYYTFTYYGRVGWPMPLFESCAALILYYFSVYEGSSTVVQAVHWMIAFPFVGAVWAITLVWCARAMRYTPPPVHQAAFWTALTTAPIVLVGPWMAYIGGATPMGFDWQRMLDVALRRGNVPPWEWLSPLYLALGFICLGLQLWLHRHMFAEASWRAWIHFLGSATIYVVVACVLGFVMQFPIRQLILPLME